MSVPRPIPNWKAIAAMAENRTIGAGNQIPWHLPEDFRWFKQCTLGKTVVMGRRTFDSLGKPLPGRTNLVLTRRSIDFIREHPAWFLGPPPAPTTAGALPTRLVVAESLDEIRALPGAPEIFIAGGATLYEQALPLCAELLLTRVKRTVDGDTVFPPFEHLFDLHEVLRDTPDFTIERWIRKPDETHGSAEPQTAATNPK